MRLAAAALTLLSIAGTARADVDPQITDALKKVKAKDYPGANAVTIISDQSVVYQPDGQFTNTNHIARIALTTTGKAAMQTLDFPADVVGNNMFYASVRTQGTQASQGMSNIVTVKAVDDTPQCTLVKMVAPTNTQNLVMGTATALTASATCPAGSVPEYQFWVKPSGAANWQILPSYTTGSESWVPPATGAWSIRAVARTTGSHVSYQVAAMSVTVNVTP